VAKVKAKRKAGARDAIRLDAFLPYGFALLAHRLGLGTGDLHARRHRVTVQEWKVLSIVADGGPVTPHEIRGRGTQDKSTISWAIKRLKRRGLVATAPRPRDGRTFEVAMTEEGWRFYGALAPEARRRADRAFAVLSAAERRALQRLVGKLLSGA
jgi:DNA-binding MarR family transcriptional regulator